VSSEFWGDALPPALADGRYKKIGGDLPFMGAVQDNP
jgi:hypothetical protein